METAALEREETHNLLLGYIIWLIGFTGAHRFYYGRPVTGTIWFCTLGLFGVGWILDAFLIPSMERSAERRYVPGRVNYSLAWILLTYLGFLGIHRFYMGKIWTGILYLATVCLGLVGVVYDFWSLNGQISEVNRART
jgi:TM2 domain-containing membrane protein YozV